MRMPSRPIRVLAPAIVAVAFVTSGLQADKNKSAVPAKPDDRTIVHVLNRIGFGPRPGDVERVREIGLQAYIDQQLQPEHLPDTAMTTRLASFETLNKSTRELSERYFRPALMARQQAKQENAQDASMKPADQNAVPLRTPEQMEAARNQRTVMAELSEQKVLRAAYSDRQLEEVMVDFWFNHFNVFAGKGQTRIYLTEYERDTIRPRALGKFRDLLGAVAESPAMLFYLDNWQSSAPIDATTAARNRQMNPRNPYRAGPRQMPPQGSRPRTVADLPPNAQNARPRGINENYARELMELHTLGVDGGYTQKDVGEVARAFTGWTIANPRQGGGFRFEPRMHDDGEKIVLGHKIKGNGQKDGQEVLDLLAKHPSTAHFISTKLVRRFVADEPPKELVDRAAERFRQTDGDIREVVRTIVTSPEFFSAEAYRAKVKTPFEFVVSAVRATGVDLASALPLVQTLRDLGMPLYMCQPPTGYADRADAWVNTGALLNRMNFALALSSGRMRGGRGGFGGGFGGGAINAPVQGSADTIVSGILAGDLSESTRTTVAKATENPQAVALVLGSPEFQRR
jgi:uncharacterized protein (DUF1800 family)